MDRRTEDGESGFLNRLGEGRVGVAGICELVDSGSAGEGVDGLGDELRRIGAKNMDPE